MRVSDHLTCLLRNLYVGQETKLESYIEQLTGSKLGKEYDKAVCCTLLTFVQSTSCQMQGWVNHKLESKLLGEIINNVRYADDTTLMAETERKKRAS